MPIPLLPVDAPIDAFPAVADALPEPNGLLAAGGDLSVARLLAAYRRGIFPWFGADELILWWSPDPRCILWPQHIHISRSLRKTLATTTMEIRINSAFPAVVAHCAQPRPDSQGTWITNSMQRAYGALQRHGHALSVECWQQDTLVGGLYGVVLGEVFCGESMFSAVRDASKIALVHLATKMHFRLIDCQLPGPHLQSMGATVVSRREFIATLQKLLAGQA